MQGFCKNCRYITKLKHNFEQGKGFEESFCCVLFAMEKGGFSVEVKLNDRCENFTERR